MLLASLATLSVPGALALTTNLTVTSQTNTGKALTGYWIDLTDSSGNGYEVGSTPATFALAPGTYIVYAGESSMWTFSNWSNGTTTMGDRVTISSSGSASIVATYCDTMTPGCGVPPVPIPTVQPSISVSSQYVTGGSVAGIYTVLQQGTTTVGTGFTPVIFSTVTSGQTYTVTASNGANAYFAQWSNGLTSNVITVTANSSRTSLTAVYCQTQGCSSGVGVVGAGGGPSGSITVTSSNLGSGAALGGMYVDLRLNNNHILDGYTPVTFSGLQLNTKYLVVLYGYGDNYFRHFSNGNLERYAYVTLNATGGQTSYSMNGLYETVPKAQAASLNIIAQFPNGTQIGTASEISGYPQHTPGMYLTVTPPGAASPYTATFTGGSILPFIFFNGQTYTVSMSAGYSNVSFSYWKDDGSTSPTRAFSLSGNSTFIAVYTQG
jgi:hypothetical protein